MTTLRKTGSATGDEELTEDAILVASRQYDIELVYEAKLGSRGLKSLGSAFQFCSALSVVDLSRNQLQSLEGIHFIAGTLTVLNVAENCLTQVSALSGCTSLQSLYLEGNQLKDSQSIALLSKLPQLDDLYLRREITLDGDPVPLVLDNPICSNVDAYVRTCVELLSKVRWVDGKLFRKLPDSKAGRETGAAVVDAQEVAGAMEKETKDALNDVTAEQKLKSLLAAAREECNAAAS